MFIAHINLVIVVMNSESKKQYYKRNSNEIYADLETAKNIKESTTAFTLRILMTFVIGIIA